MKRTSLTYSQSFHLKHLNDYGCLLLGFEFMDLLIDVLKCCKIIMNFAWMMDELKWLENFEDFAWM